MSAATYQCVALVAWLCAVLLCAAGARLRGPVEGLGCLVLCRSECVSVGLALSQSVRSV